MVFRAYPNHRHFQKLAKDSVERLAKLKFQGKIISVFQYNTKNRGFGMDPLNLDFTSNELLPIELLIWHQIVTTKT